ncbi:MAG: T9SS type A sorting domain-containing protein [Candidatus Zixiibacteriota bacterium]|nr:MAG: T9SS type A sorting domain-containing protein [candidate division Zixibacteria bacterium]
MGKMINIFLLLCLVLPFSSVLGQAGSANYNLSTGYAVGGGGVSGSTNYGVTGSVPLSGSGFLTSNSFVLSGGVIGISGGLAVTLEFSYNGSSQMVVPAGTARTLTVTIISGTGADTSATLYYRLTGQTGYASVSMTLSGSTLSYEVSGDVLGVQGLEYYIRVTVGNDTEYIGSALAPYVFITNLSNEQAQRPTRMPDARYRIIGVPINTTSHAVATVFEDDLGSYNQTRWRMGSWDAAGDSVKEYPDVDACYPGQGYWLIARGGKTYGAPGRSIRPNDSYAGIPYYRVALDSGWNQLANPFPFRVSWGEILFDDNGVVSGHLPGILDDVAYWYSGSKYDTVTTIPAWDGIFVEIKKTGVDALVRCREVAAPAKPLPQDYPLISKDCWAISLRLEVNGLVDDGNYAGVRKDALAGLDNYDFSEPPPPPGGPRLAFKIPEENCNLKRTDFRPPIEQGATWEIDISRGDGGTLTFTDIDQIPNGMEAWVTIGSRMTAIVTEGTSITLPDNSKSAQLVIGTSKYVEEETSGLLPGSFVLEQNHPNPFNPVTRIGYSLPNPGHVRLEVFNILGQSVQVLIDAEMPAGRHIAVWDGNDAENKPVASGIYFYRIDYGELNKTRKMLLVK